MPNGHRLAILDVGHGNSSVLIDEDGIVVIDTGRGDSLRQYLKQQGIERVDIVLLSHADQDHIGGLIHLLACAEFTLGRVHINADSKQRSALWDDLRYELDRAHNSQKLAFEVSLTSDATGRFDHGGVRLEILGPSRYLASGGPGSRDREGRRVTTNSISAVVRLLDQGQPIALLPGDLDEVGLSGLLESGKDMTAQIVVFPHHGGGAGRTDMTAFTKALCEAVKPEIVVFSIGRGVHGTPRPEVIGAIRQTLPEAWIACTQLSEHCSETPPTAEPSHLGEAFARGRERHHCCAGTIVVNLNRPDAILPSREAHQAFVSSSTVQPLCRR